MSPANYAALTRPFAVLLASPIALPAGWIVYIGLGISASFGAGLIALGIRFAVDARRGRREPPI